jgi:hypothetical protein
MVCKSPNSHWRRETQHDPLNSWGSLFPNKLPIPNIMLDQIWCSFMSWKSCLSQGSTDPNLPSKIPWRHHPHPASEIQSAHHTFSVSPQWGNLFARFSSWNFAQLGILHTEAKVVLWWFMMYIKIYLLPPITKVAKVDAEGPHWASEHTARSLLLQWPRSVVLWAVEMGSPGQSSGQSSGQSFAGWFGWDFVKRSPLKGATL